MEKANENFDENETKKNEIDEDEINENIVDEVEVNEQLENDDDENDKSQCEEDSPEVITLEEQMNILKSQKSVLKDENEKLKNELDALKDRLARTLAEYDNYRKRTIKEKEAIYTEACGDVLKNVFPIMDNLERASVVNGNVDDIKKGIDMTVKSFNEALKKLEVEEIDASGDFDPNFHNAVMHVEDETVGTNQVVEVLQKGYKKGEKVLRYSMVKVAN